MTNTFQEIRLSNCRIIDIPTFTDKRGSITIAEELQTTFICKRVFWLHHILESKDRGSHALRTSNEVMVAVHGSLIAELSDGQETQEITLENPSKGLFIPAGIWFRTHSFSTDGVCLILASAEYSKDEYIYDYEEYKRLKQA